MAEIGKWVWHTDEAQNKVIALIVGFDFTGAKAKLMIFPDGIGGQIKIRFSDSDQYTYLEKEEMSNMAVKNAYDDGFEMGKALREVFSNGSDYNSNPQAVFALGRKFATMAGYAGLDDGFKFIEGFVTAFQTTPKQITSNPN